MAGVYSMAGLSTVELSGTRTGNETTEANAK